MKHVTLYVGVPMCKVLKEKESRAEFYGISSYTGEGELKLLSVAGSTKPK